MSGSAMAGWAAPPAAAAQASASSKAAARRRGGMPCLRRERGRLGAAARLAAAWCAREAAPKGRQHSLRACLETGWEREESAGESGSRGGGAMIDSAPPAGRRQAARRRVLSGAGQVYNLLVNFPRKPPSSFSSHSRRTGLATARALATRGASRASPLVLSEGRYSAASPGQQARSCAARTFCARLWRRRLPAWEHGKGSGCLLRLFPSLQRGGQRLLDAPFASLLVPCALLQASGRHHRPPTTARAADHHRQAPVQAAACAHLTAAAASLPLPLGSLFGPRQLACQRAIRLPTLPLML